MEAPKFYRLGQPEEGAYASLRKAHSNVKLRRVARKRFWACDLPIAAIGAD